MIAYKDTDCPHQVKGLFGDETYVTCNLNSKPCLIEYGDTCDTYQDFLEQYLAERDEELSDRE